MSASMSVFQEWLLGMGMRMAKMKMFITKGKERGESQRADRDGKRKEEGRKKDMFTLNILAPMAVFRVGYQSKRMIQ